MSKFVVGYVISSVEPPLREHPWDREKFPLYNGGVNHLNIVMW